MQISFFVSLRLSLSFARDEEATKVFFRSASGKTKKPRKLSSFNLASHKRGK
jgi:hypothetical protein